MSLKGDTYFRLHHSIFDGGYTNGYYSKLKVMGVIVPMEGIKYSMREWTKTDHGERKCCICKKWPSKIFVIEYLTYGHENKIYKSRSGYNCCSESCFNMFLMTRDEDSTVWI